MTRELDIHCQSGSPDGAEEMLSISHGTRTHHLKLKIAELSAKLVENLDPLIADLIEVAGFVYAADSTVRRGGPTAERMGQQWRRSFHFDVPVRCPDIWSQKQVTEALEETLSFVSDDRYRFTFRLAENPAPFNGYFEFGPERNLTPASVMMFSGGLDSFSGALEEVIGNRRPTVLVTHRSGSKLAPVQRRLIKYLNEQVDVPSVLHVPVTAQIANGGTNESTHRSRSFLFAALGIATARCLGLDHLKFYENGVVSMNLPLGNHVVGSRATRSTHPETLAGFTRFFSLLLGKDLRVDNPFFWKTKAEVIGTVRQYAAQDQIEHTRSCAHVRDITKQHSHCGSCSQCVDRRLSMLVCGLSDLDPAEKYRFDLFTDPFRSTQEKEMALAYIRAARRYQSLDERTFVTAFPEAIRALNALGQDRKAGLQRLVALHKRHGAGVAEVIDTLLADSLKSSEVNPTGEDTLQTIVGQERFAARQPMLVETRECASENSTPRDIIRVKLVEAPRGTTVEIDGLGSFDGASAQCLISFAEHFLNARGRGLVPEDYPCTNARNLVDAWELETEEAVRKRISGFRSLISKRAKAAGMPAPDANAIIENIPWHGYRLNPTGVEVTRVQP